MLLLLGAAGGSVPPAHLVAGKDCGSGRGGDRGQREVAGRVVWLGVAAIPLGRRRRRSRSPADAFVLRRRRAEVGVVVVAGVVVVVEVAGAGAGGAGHVIQYGPGLDRRRRTAKLGVQLVLTGAEGRRGGEGASGKATVQKTRYETLPCHVAINSITQQNAILSTQHSPHDLQQQIFNTTTKQHNNTTTQRNATQRTAECRLPVSSGGLLRMRSSSSPSSTKASFSSRLLTSLPAREAACERATPRMLLWLLWLLRTRSPMPIMADACTATSVARVAAVTAACRTPMPTAPTEMPEDCRGR